jgi:hypothetical protein
MRRFQAPMINPLASPCPTRPAHWCTRARWASLRRTSRGAFTRGFCLYGVASPQSARTPQRFCQRRLLLFDKGPNTSAPAVSKLHAGPSGAKTFAHTHTGCSGRAQQPAHRVWLVRAQQHACMRVHNPSQQTSGARMHGKLGGTVARHVLVLARDDRGSGGVQVLGAPGPSLGPGAASALTPPTRKSLRASTRTMRATCWAGAPAAGSTWRWCVPRHAACP